MDQQFDIAVLGAGPGGYVAALKAAQLGARTAIVEKHHWGGTCLNYGCIPSKALLASAGMLHEMRQADSLGLELRGEVLFHWDKIQQRKDKVVQTLRKGVQGLLGARKVTLFTGHAVMEAPHRVVVRGEAQAEQRFTARKVILATGSVPARLPGWPEDPDYVCTSDEALHWQELPQSLLIVGGGVIGCEIACMLQPFGVQVTVVEMLPELLPTVDGQLGAALRQEFGRRGIACHVNMRIQSLEVAEQSVQATLANGQKISAQKALVATGRRPATQDVGLENLKLATEKGFVPVNDQMATQVPDHFCIGDANGRCLLAHAASAQGMVAVENALGHRRSFTVPVPSCIYTFPEIASVGLSEQEAAARDLPVTIGNFSLSHLGKAMAAGHAQGFVKVVRHRESDEVLGVHMLGAAATECIAAAGALLHQRAKALDLADVVFAHPTMSESIREATEDALSMGLHAPPRKILRLAV